jgi:hypothetical protein
MRTVELDLLLERPGAGEISKDILAEHVWIAARRAADV